MRARKIRSATVQKQKTRRAVTRMPQGKSAKFQAYKSGRDRVPSGLRKRKHEEQKKHVSGSVLTQIKIATL